jgi:dUTP pyrophosphatase
MELTLSVQCLSSETLALYKSHSGLQHAGDAGIDLYVPRDIIVPANVRGFALDHDVACAMYHLSITGPVHHSYYLYPRSSISKTPLRMCNSVGIIDSGYRGHIIGMVDNVSDKDYEVKAGTRLFQICGPRLEPLKLGLVDKLSQTTRGTGGFGSTGI